MSREWETSHTLRENIAKDTFDKEVLPQMYKKLIKLNNKKTTWLKKESKILTDNSPKKI